MPAHADLSVDKYYQHDAIASPVVYDPLDPFVPSFQKPWNAQRVAHLYRRLGFGATYDQIQQGLQMSPGALVDQLLDTAANLAPLAPPSWANFTTDDYAGDNVLVEAHRREMRHRWLSDMLNEGIRAKMALFWHNHFVTQSLIIGCNSYQDSYYALLHQYAFGNFREFTLEMGKNPAMLVYLNGNVNIVGEPNENYARELMELFTMGESNGYTQLDVVEMSRALTGWKAYFNECWPREFKASDFDNAPKTIFGKTGNFNFDDAHNLIFSERPNEASTFIAGKIYKHFVYQTPNPEVVDGLATTLRDTDWEMLSMLKQLLKSEHFFEAEFINARIKSPLDTLIPMLKWANAKYPDNILPDWWDDITFYARRLGQELFEPPNVAGWPEHRIWINESTLASRWNYAALTATLLTFDSQLLDNLRTLAKNLTNDSNKPEIITPALIDFFTGQSLDDIHLNAAIGYFKAGVPENYFTDGSWNLNWDSAPEQIVNLIKYLATLPEFQLS